MPREIAENVLSRSDDYQESYLNKLDVEDPQDQRIIAEVGIRSDFWRVRQLAAGLLNPDTQAEALKKIIFNDNDDDVKEAAIARFDPERHTMDSIVVGLRSNSELLEKALRNANWRDHGDILAETATESRSWKARQLAVSILHPRLHAEVLQSVISTDSDEDVVHEARKRLNEADEPHWAELDEELDVNNSVEEGYESAEELIEPEDAPVETEKEKQQRIEVERNRKISLVNEEDNVRKIVRFCTDENDDEVRLAALKKLKPSMHSRQIEKCLKRGSEAVQLSALDLIDPKISSMIIVKLSKRAEYESVRLAAIGKLDPVQHKYVLEKIVRKSSGDIQAAAQIRLAV